MQTERIGFVGLGDMGGPMAENLARSGAAPAVYDLRAEAVASAAALGAVPISSVAEVAESSDIVFVCVLDAAQVHDVVAGTNGLFAAWRGERTASLPTPLVVVHSTVTPATVQALVDPGQLAGARVLDAAVSGGRAVAVEGKLTLLVGGATEDVVRCKPFFDVVAGTVFHVGEESGAGEAAKLCNNIMALCNGFATLEAAKLAEAYHIDQERLVELASASTGDSWMIRNWGFIDDVMASHTDSPVSTMTKDLVSAVQAAHDAEIELPFVSIAVGAATDLLTEWHAKRSKTTGRE